MEIDLDLKQLDLLVTEIGKIAATHPLINTILNAMANHLINLIREKAPKDTGEYAASWTASSLGSSSIKVSTFMSELFIILEYTGSDPHIIEAGILSGKSGKMALHWVDKQGVDQFRVRVPHPGFDNMPHVRPALEQLQRDQPTIVYAAVAVFFPGILGRVLQSHVTAFNSKIGKATEGGLTVTIKPITPGSN